MDQDKRERTTIRFPNLLLLDKTQIRLLRMRWADDTPGVETQLTIMLRDLSEELVIPRSDALSIWEENFKGDKIPSHLKPLFVTPRFESAWIDPSDLLIAAVAGDPPAVILTYRSARHAALPPTVTVRVDPRILKDARVEHARGALSEIERWMAGTNRVS